SLSAAMEPRGLLRLVGRGPGLSGAPVATAPARWLASYFRPRALSGADQFHLDPELSGRQELRSRRRDKPAETYPAAGRETGQLWAGLPPVRLLLRPADRQP